MAFTIINDNDQIAVLDFALPNPVVLYAIAEPYSIGWRLRIKSDAATLYSIESLMIGDVQTTFGPMTQDTGNAVNWRNTAAGNEALLRNYHSGSGGWVLYVDGPDADNLPDDFAVFASSWQINLPQMALYGGEVWIQDFTNIYPNLTQPGAPTLRRTSESETRRRLTDVLLPWAQQMYG